MSTNKEFIQVPDLNVDTAELSEINFYRAWWYIMLFVQERSPYEVREYLCLKCLTAYHSDDSNDPAHKCIQEEWKHLDCFNDCIRMLNDFIVLKQPYDAPLTEEDLILLKTKIKQQEICFNNFQSLEYYQDSLAEIDGDEIYCY